MLGAPPNDKNLYMLVTFTHQLEPTETHILNLYFTYDYAAETPISYYAIYYEQNYIQLNTN